MRNKKKNIKMCLCFLQDVQAKKAFPGNNHFPGECCSSKKEREAYSCVIPVTSYPASVITKSLASSTFFRCCEGCSFLPHGEETTFCTSNAASTALFTCACNVHIIPVTLTVTLIIVVFSFFACIINIVAYIGIIDICRNTL